MKFLISICDIHLILCVKALLNSASRFYNHNVCKSTHLYFKRLMCIYLPLCISCVKATFDVCNNPFPIIFWFIHYNYEDSFTPISDTATPTSENIFI